MVNSTGDNGLRRPLSLYGLSGDDQPLRASGCRYEVGHIQGSAYRNQIHRFLGDDLTRIGPVLGRSVELHEFTDSIKRYEAEIEKKLPDLVEELSGLAEGADITMEAAYLLQLRRELVGYQSVRPAGDCTSFARLIPGQSVLGQTIDLNGLMAPELTAMQIELEDSDRRLQLVSFTGLLGYLGMNDSGLAIGLNLVLGGSWRPGIPGYMLIRHLLDEASSVDECLERMAELPRASSRSMTICDGRRLVVVEYVPDEMIVMEQEEFVHANHFLHPHFRDQDELNPFARTSSIKRQEACSAALELTPKDAEVSAYLNVLNSPGIYVRDTGDVRRECTVGSVVMYPEQGKMHVQKTRCANSKIQKVNGGRIAVTEAYEEFENSAG